MTWEQIRHQYPNQWLIVEVRTWTQNPLGRTLVFGVLAGHRSCGTLLYPYFQLARLYPWRDYYLAHTASPTLQVRSHQG